MSFWDEKETNRLSQKLQFYNVLIEKPRINVLKTEICCMNFHFMMN